VPGLLLAGSYAAYALGYAWLFPAAAPALPREEHLRVGQGVRRRVMRALVPPLLLILLVLGSIFFGVATATEAGAVGAVGAMILAAINRRLTGRAVRETMDGTLRMTCMIMMLLIGSALFTLVFRGLNGDLWIEHHLTQLPGGVIGFLLLANLVVFVLGFFIDFFEIAFIILPLLVPAAHALGIDPVWFGVMLGVNLQTSFLTPPFGFALFYLRGVAPASVKTTDIYRGVIPFILIQLLMLAALIAFPGLVSR
jgi:tripartite ATP-independent transporter DctM subunit